MAAAAAAAAYEGKGKKTIVRLQTEDDVAVALAKYTAHLSRKFITHKGSFCEVLSGGSVIDTMRYRESRVAALGRYLQNPLAMVATLCGFEREVLCWKRGSMDSYLMRYSIQQMHLCAPELKNITDAEDILPSSPLKKLKLKAQ